jgi:hypothetical protein
MARMNLCFYQPFFLVFDFVSHSQFLTARTFGESYSRVESILKFEGFEAHFDIPRWFYHF